MLQSSLLWPVLMLTGQRPVWAWLQTWLLTGNWRNIPASPQPTLSNPSLGGFSTSTTSFLTELSRRLSSVLNIFSALTLDLLMHGRYELVLAVVQESWLVQIVPVTWLTRRSQSQLEQSAPLPRLHSSVSLTAHTPSQTHNRSECLVGCSWRHK